MTDLTNERFVTMHPGFGMRRLLDELCAAAQFQPRIVLESANLTTAAGLVAAGLGISLVPIGGSEYASGVSALRAGRRRRLPRRRDDLEFRPTTVPAGP